jgi:cytochrome c-type biogenesis protein CcmH
MGRPLLPKRPGLLAASLIAASLLLAAPPLAAQMAAPPPAAPAAPAPPAQDQLVQEQALPDQAAESRAMALAREIRCVVCENEPVANSSAEIAVDMRNAIREKVAAGASDDEVRAYFASRYGEFVLLRPRLSTATLLLWGAPFLLILIGGAVLLLRARKPVTAAAETADPELDAAARAALARAEAARSDS